jgi:hypothetical protein
MSVFSEVNTCARARRHRRFNHRPHCGEPGPCDAASTARFLEGGRGCRPHPVEISGCKINTGPSMTVSSVPRRTPLPAIDWSDPHDPGVRRLAGPRRRAAEPADQPCALSADASFRIFAWTLLWVAVASSWTPPAHETARTPFARIAVADAGLNAHAAGLGAADGFMLLSTSALAP